MNHITENDVYTVTFVIAERAYLYPCFCLNHQQALEKAFAGHLEAFGPLPMGTRCLVHGLCHDTNCNCRGKNLVIDCFTCPEGVRITNYQHD
jgi:hypothetical protein